MPGQIVVCADDYAISEGTSAVILELLERGAINATTCLVETEAWPRTAEALRRLADARPGIAVGLHLNLTEQFENNAVPDAVRPLGYWLCRAFMRLARGTAEAALASFRGQWGMFLRHFGRAPDFLDGHQHVQLYGPARSALLRLAMETGFEGWLRQSGTSCSRFLAQRILMDPASARLAQQARALGIPVNPRFGGLRAFRRGENLRHIWSRDLAGLRGGGLFIVHPGSQGSPPGADAVDLCRIDEAEALRAEVMGALLHGLGLELARDARHPGWNGGE